MPIPRNSPMSLHYRSYPCTSAEAGATPQRVLLLHGLGSSLADWELQIPALTPLYDVLACDLRGHGRRRTACRAATSISEMAQDVAELLRSHAPRQRQGAVQTHVVGLSMGAIASARVVVNPDSGHATPIDQSAVFNAEVLQFLTV